MGTMTNSNITEEQVVEYFNALPPWAQKDFSDSEWACYIEVARIIQKADPNIVESALNKFIVDAVREEYAGYESESKVFILMRVVFDLPEEAYLENRRSFKGWANWPEPDEKGNVSLSWPVSWRTGKPKLIAPYEGSMGKPYAAGMEYRYMRDRFPFRQLENQFQLLQRRYTDNKF